MINAISPIDGRYSSKTISLQEYFSEAALIKYRVKVEVAYFLHLGQIGIIDLSSDDKDAITSIAEDFSNDDAERVKEIEKVTNHDVKAVEYLIKEKAKDGVNPKWLEFVHFGLTSQDINNTAIPLMLKDAMQKTVLPALQNVVAGIQKMADDHKTTPLLARTHGQSATPTTMGKEMMVFVDRLQKQLNTLENHRYEAKFGGATGNFNAHRLAYPKVNWPGQIDQLISSLGLDRQQYTTQIDQYDNMVEVFHCLARVNNILIDFSRDIWTYVSMDYFKQKVVANEVGSSAMPHKVNPIDFENAEGNLGFASAILEFLARKLPISRLQRDLTDSTVTRNIGVPLGHILIASASLQKGIAKLEINEAKISKDLTEAWAVVSEGIQTILRREGWNKPYELLKTFSRGKGKLTEADFIEFINGLDASPVLKQELLAITPHNYIGYAAE
ncbi:MAG: adenylosuccinate lyase [Saprospiraceae bacterium]|jgi:adenylosuccinate lyase